MGSIVKYNSKFLVPVSTVNITHTMPSNVDGTCVRPTYNIDINGYLIYHKGSPTSSGTFGNFESEVCETIDSEERVRALLSKHCAVGDLFSENYKLLELGTASVSTLTSYPRVLSYSLSDTSNPSYWMYNISLEASDMFCDGVSISPTGTGCFPIKSFEESWDISYDEAEFISESGENRLFKLSHQISAVGVGIIGSGGITEQPYVSAKNFVNSKKGPNSIVPSVCFSGFSSGATRYNHYESHNVDVANGSYSLSENWITSTNPYIESYSVETSDSNDTACPTVSIQGVIRGFDIRDNDGEIKGGKSRYYHANTRWLALEATSGVYVNATGMSGYTLHPTPINGTVGKNKYTGEITYNRTYKNSQFRFLTSAKSENISYGTNWNEDSFATIQLLNGGQVLHPLNYTSSGTLAGKNLNKYTLSINAIYPCGTGISRKGPRFTSPYGDEIQAVVNYYSPTGDASNWFTVVESQTETWIPADGSYSYSVSWASQPSGNCELF